MTTEEPAPFREPFDPSCTEWTTFGELEVSDYIDYWGEARPVVLLHQYEHEERVRIIVQGPYGQDLALALKTERTYRMPRENRNEAIIRGLYRNVMAGTSQFAPADAERMAAVEDEMVPQITAAIEAHPNGTKMLRDLLLGKLGPGEVRAILMQTDPPFDVTRPENAPFPPKEDPR